MDITTAYSINGLFASPCWLAFPVLAFISFVAIFIVKGRAKAIPIILTVVTVLIYGTALFLSMYTYSILSNAEVTYDTPGTRNIRAELADRYTVRFTNEDVEAWTFGEYYRLQILLGSKWYNVEAKADYAVHDLAYELQPGQSILMPYDMDPFEPMASGHYRLVCGGLGNGSGEYYVEFDV